jgi:thiamine biosynthesis lipoprotein
MISKLAFRAMGCHMLAAIEYPPARAANLLERVPGWFEGWEDALSRFRPESELTRLNQAAGEAVKVSETLWEVFMAANKAYQESGGLVTPLVLGALVEAGYERSFDLLSRDQTVGVKEKIMVRALEEVERWPESHTLRLPIGEQIEFGGVAKGWAAHQAMLRLKGYGPVLINAGGDIAISGLGAEAQPWLVGIDDPFQAGQSLGTLRLGRCGVATSGRDYRQWTQNGVMQHHIIDPRTAEPAKTDVISATVVAPTVLEAEMAAKVLLILGSQAGRTWLADRPNLAGLMVTENGQLHCNRSFEKYFGR